ncbi:MAG: SDR family NAD(P)-dependent oxidoreductase [Acidimicrobiia bacterium]
MTEKQQGKLAGRCAIVTGGGSGIGRVTALCLASHGAAVALADINGDAAGAVAAEVEAAGGRALAVIADLGIEKSIIAMIEQTVAEFGRLDILHNNAAVLSPNVLGRDNLIHEMNLEVWNTTFAVNLTGAMLASKYAIPHMINSGGGSIINTSSGAAFRGDVRQTAYGISKAALNALTKSIAVQYGKQGIRCNAIAPGMIVHAALKNDEAALAARLEKHSTPRLGAPEDIANAVAFLASDEASFITAQIISVDGGYLDRSPWLNFSALR